MLDLTFEQLNNAKFELYEGNPVIRRFGVSPMIADPSVLTPDLTPDGKWRLYAHALWGVYEYLSDDGITFERGRKIVPRAMRPDMKKVGDVYYLFTKDSNRYSVVPRDFSAASGSRKFTSPKAKT